jgi:hypothetical protein
MGPVLVHVVLRTVSKITGCIAVLKHSGTNVVHCRLVPLRMDLYQIRTNAHGTSIIFFVGSFTFLFQIVFDVF